MVVSRYMYALFGFVNALLGRVLILRVDRQSSNTERQSCLVNAACLSSGWQMSDCQAESGKRKLAAAEVAQRQAMGVENPRLAHNPLAAIFDAELYIADA